MISGRTRTVFKKEVVDNVRDRRTLAAALFYPVLGPAMILFMIFAIGQLRGESEQALMLPVQGADNAPNLIAFLEQNHVAIQATPDEPEEAVRQGSEDVVLIIPEEFGEAFTDGRPATVRLVMDQSRNEAMRSIRRAQLLLQAYSHQIGRLRLQVRGVDPRVADAIAIEAVDVSTPQSQAARILSMAPYLILVSLFVGGMYLAIDSTAGERERCSLEPLLINPVERSELVNGKAAAVLVFTTVALIETLVGFAIVLNFFPLERYIGVRMSLPPASLGAILLICLPLMVFVVALQMIIASYTKSFKEAQELYFVHAARAGRAGAHHGSAAGQRISLARAAPHGGPAALHQPDPERRAHFPRLRRARLRRHPRRRHRAPRPRHPPLPNRGYTLSLTLECCRHWWIERSTTRLE